MASRDANQGTCVDSNDETVVESDISLSYDEVDNYAGAPYYKFGVLVDGQNPKLYIDTRSQQLLYDPPVYLGTWHSNHSVVMKWERSNDGDYIWKNVVIPNWSLTMTTRFQAGKTTEEKSSPITYLVGFNAVLRPPKVTRHHNRTGAYAFSFTQEGTNLFLKPQEVPVYDHQGRVEGQIKTIVAVQDTLPDNYYLFTIHPTSYVPPTS
ncbi:uncharacterized protein LOC135343856 [Halichondria panicea]|uniref:uncharacterized protein LOC135343856 n=1 Tax=Halichondria panicea TaxID=6063 RepID=UPI00312B5DE4